VSRARLHRARPRWRPALAVSLAVATALAPCRVERAVAASSRPSSPKAVPIVAVPSLTAIPTPLRALGAGSFDLSSSPTAAPSRVGIPTQIDIPAIGVHARIVPLGLHLDGTIQVPGRFDEAGWYQGGPRPGDLGPSVILGHLDSLDGPAVFLRLRDLTPGQIVSVSSGSDAHRFRVDAVATFGKDRFPTSLVYGPVPGAALRLVTCGGSFDDVKHSYRANVVVFATELSP
jgi:Sortase domain